MHSQLNSQMWNPRIGRADCIFIGKKKYAHVGGFVQFKPVLLKGWFYTSLLEDRRKCIGVYSYIVMTGNFKLTFSYVHAERMKDHSEILSIIYSEKPQLP